MIFTNAIIDLDTSAMHARLYPIDSLFINNANTTIVCFQDVNNVIDNVKMNTMMFNKYMKKTQCLEINMIIVKFENLYNSI